MIPLFNRLIPEFDPILYSTHCGDDTTFHKNAFF